MIIIQHDKVSLRPIELSDKERLVELANNKNVSINLRDGFPNPYSRDDAEKFIKNCISQKPVTVFAIEFEGLYVGNISLIPGTDVYRRSAEIGYFLGELYWNKGIMTRAVNLICEYGFKNFDIERIHTGVFDYNHASQRVLEKCGFKKEGTFRRAVFKGGKFFDEIRYSKLRNE